MNISLKKTGSIFLPVKGKASKRENLADWRLTSPCSAAHTCSPGCQQFTNLQTPNTKKSIKHHPLAEEAELRKFRRTGRWFGKEQGLLWPLTLPFSLCICFNKLIVFLLIMVCSRRSLRRLGFGLELKYGNGLKITLEFAKVEVTEILIIEMQAVTRGDGIFLSCFLSPLCSLILGCTSFSTSRATQSPEWWVRDCRHTCVPIQAQLWASHSLLCFDWIDVATAAGFYHIPIGPLIKKKNPLEDLAAWKAR